ncbi:hypothetical protein JTB14_037083 [Gonioctena quinquepunctata]|nr:hypothetical protein JTB14_037083 [Gonioctena quinquepunctata]
MKNPLDKKISPLYQADRYEASFVLVKRVQASSFSHEISRLQNEAILPKPLRKLNPFLSQEGILRVEGRLQFSGLSFSHKHPASLPNKQRLTDLTIHDTHSQHLDPGLPTLQFPLAHNFWILSPERAIYRVISECYRCFRVDPELLFPPMGSLPEPRINQQCVGVAYGGPYNITMSKERGI